MYEDDNAGWSPQIYDNVTFNHWQKNWGAELSQHGYLVPRESYYCPAANPPPVPWRWDRVYGAFVNVVGNGPSVRIANVKDALPVSTTGYIFDSCRSFPNGSQWVNVYRVETAFGQQVRRWHGEVANALFLDGHASGLNEGGLRNLHVSVLYSWPK